MKKIDMYITSKFIKSFFVGMAGFIVIFILSSLFKVVGYIIDQKISTYNGVILLGAGLPDVIVNVVPLAILLGGLMTVNKMATNSEIIALKTSGISFFRIVKYPIIISFIISIFMLWFNDAVVPDMNKLKREIKYTKVYDVRDSRIKTEVYLKGSGNNIYYISMINGSNGTFMNMLILIMDKSMTKVQKIVVAEKGEYDFKEKTWNLKECVINDIVTGKTEKQTLYKAKFIKESPEEFLKDKIRENEMKADDLKEAIKFINKTGGDVKKLMVALYKKTAYPFSGFIMCFIGLSLGSRYVRGASAVSIALSVVIGYIYYVVMATMEALGAGGFINPMIGEWVPNVIFIAVGIVTMRQSEY